MVVHDRGPDPLPLPVGGEPLPPVNETNCQVSENCANAVEVESRPGVRTLGRRGTAALGG